MSTSKPKDKTAGSKKPVNKIGEEDITISTSSSRDAVKVPDPPKKPGN